MPHPLSHKYPIPIFQLCLVNTDVPGGVGAPPLDTTSKVHFDTFVHASTSVDMLRDLSSSVSDHVYIVYLVCMTYSARVHLVILFVDIV